MHAHFATNTHPFPPASRGNTTNAALRALLRKAFARRERPNAVEWCEANISDIPYSPIPGRFRIYNSPFLRPIMEAITSRRLRKIVISACVQSGKTLAPELCLCYLIANAPAPALWLDMTDDSARDQSENRLQPLFENCAPVNNSQRPFPPDCSLHLFSLRPRARHPIHRTA